MLQHSQYQLTSASQVQDLKLQKKSVTELSGRKRTFLDNLQGHVGSLVKAAMPLQEHLIASSSTSFGCHSDSRAQYLPPPLYVLYCQAQACCELLGADMLRSSISGELDAAAAAAHAELEKLRSTSSDVVDEQSRPKKLPKKDKRNDEGLHSLTVDLEVLPEKGATSDVAVLAKINFKYVPKLNLVLAHAGDDGSESSAMLSKLYSDESTLDTMLEQTTDGRNIDDHLASLREFDSSWRPYKWAQWLCSIPLLTQGPIDSGAEAAIEPQQRLPDLVERIRRRLLALKTSAGTEDSADTGTKPADDAQKMPLKATDGGEAKEETDAKAP